MTERHLVSFIVRGRPATFATAHEAAWRDAVSRAVRQSGITPSDARFAVRIEFRSPPPRTANEVWDLDDLIKPTLDAMEGVFGTRAWRRVPQPADDRVDRSEASKRPAADDDEVSATVEVWRIEDAARAPAAEVPRDDEVVVRRMADPAYRQVAWEQRYSERIAPINRYVEELRGPEPPGGRGWMPYVHDIYGGVDADTGRVAAGFAWTDPDEHRTAEEVLLSEGLRFVDGVAEVAQRLGQQELLLLTDG